MLKNKKSTNSNLTSLMECFNIFGKAIIYVFTNLCNVPLLLSYGVSKLCRFGVLSLLSCVVLQWLILCNEWQVQLEPTTSWALVHKDLYRQSKYTGIIQATKDILREEGLPVASSSFL